MKHGSIHALVGSSGSGNTYSIRWSEGFSDIQHGSVLVDGVYVLECNIQWLFNHTWYHTSHLSHMMCDKWLPLSILSILEKTVLGASNDFKDGKLERKQVPRDEIGEV